MVVSAILLLLTSWTFFYLIHTFLIEFKHTSPIYAKFLSKNGLSINIFQIKWYTVRCNRLFMKLSNIKPKFLKAWFNCGVLVGVIGQALSIILLTYTLADYFRQKPATEQILVPVLPGVNLPHDQTVYYFLALFICGLVHEFGHAIAASREQVRVNGFGLFVMFIFPGAYVDLCSDHLQIISPIRQLRIFCAGVWHNLVIVLVSIALIQIHPFLINSLFNRNAYVNNISQNSPLKSLLNVDSVIFGVDNCQVTDTFSFYECLFKIDKSAINNGHCIPMSDILYLNSNFIVQKSDAPDLDECCHLNSTATNYCFKWASYKENKKHYACLPARFVTEKAACVEEAECGIGTSNSVCAKPVSDNSTKLVKITHDSGSPVLYVGSISELIYSIQIDEFRPKHKLVPRFLNLQLLLLLKYIVAFSGAIGLLNLVPCFALDGQYILAANLHLIRHRNRPANFVDLNAETQGHPMIYAVIMMLGTGLLILNISLSLFSLFVSKIG